MDNLITPTPVVRQDEQHSAKFWHETALEIDKQKSDCNLKHAEALYNLKKSDGFKQLGFDSWGTYIFENFNRSQQWANKLANVHEVYVVNLQVSIELLKKVGYAKLSMMSAHVNEENVLDTLNDLISMTQKEVADKIRESKGLMEGMEDIDDDDIQNTEEPEKEEQVKYTLKGPKDIVEVIRTAVDSGRSLYAKATSLPEEKVSDLSALEYVCAIFFSASDLSGEPTIDLDTAIKSLENTHKIKITWEEENAT